MKLCFISYARNNNLDGRIAKFVRKLVEQIPGHLPHGTKPEAVAFFDTRAFTVGAVVLDTLTHLELDLSKLRSAPATFRKR